MNSLPFLLLALVMSVLISSLVIWLLGKLELGLVVERFGSAPIAGVLIGAVAGVVTVLFSLLGMQDSTDFFGGMLHFFGHFRRPDNQRPPAARHQNGYSAVVPRPSTYQAVALCSETGGTRRSAPHHRECLISALRTKVTLHLPIQAASRGWWASPCACAM